MPKARGPLDMGGNKVQNAGNGSASGDLVAYGQLGTAAFQPTGAFDAAGAAAAVQTAITPQITAARILQRILFA